jgi:hypothetical protein
MKRKQKIFLISIFVLCVTLLSLFSLNTIEATVGENKIISDFQTVDIAQFKVPAKIFPEHLNYVAVGGDEDKPDRWEVQEAYLVNLSGSSDKALVVTVRSYQGQMPASAGVFVLQKSIEEKGSWGFVAFRGSGEYVKVRFEDVDGKPGLELILDGGQGNHGREMEILALRNMKLVSLGTFEGYGYGVGLEKIDGRVVVVNYHQELPEACEACQSYYPEIFDFNGNSFVARKDDFLDCLKATMGARDTQAESLKCAECFSKVLKSRPNLFGALIQAEYCYRKNGDVKKSGELLGRIRSLEERDLVYSQGPKDMKKKRSRYLEEKFGLK